MSTDGDTRRQSAVFLRLLTIRVQVRRERIKAISKIWSRAAFIIRYACHSLHYLKLHNRIAFVADKAFYFFCRGWMNGSRECWKQEHVPTHRQQWERHAQAVRPNSAPLYSAMYLTHLTSERTHFQKGSKVRYLQSWGWCMCVCGNDSLCKLSGCTYYISAELAVCVCTSVCLCQRGFPVASVTQSHTVGVGGLAEHWQL